MRGTYEKLNYIDPPIMYSFFEILGTIYNARDFKVFSSGNQKTANHSLETICYRAHSLWEKLLPEYKFAISYNNLKRKMKRWKGENYQCWLCETTFNILASFVSLGFLKCL